MSAKPRIWHGSSDAVNFWREKIVMQPGFKPAAESFTVLVLDGERRLVGAHAVSSKSFGDAQRFADALFNATFLRGVPEFVLIHNRPSVALKTSADDVARVRAVILAGRARKTELLDCLIVGEPDGTHLSGVLSFRRIRGFSAENPFAKSSKKPRKISAKPEATK